KNTRRASTPQVNAQSATLPADLDANVKKNVNDWRASGKVRRLWQKDASLWTDAAEVKAAGFSDILLLGMGGSSLCPEVLSLTYPQTPGFPRLHILDSTDPAQ